MDISCFYTLFSIVLFLGPSCDSKEAPIPSTVGPIDSLPRPAIIETVLISNDGPVILGSSITCYARIVFVDGYESTDNADRYEFYWKEEASSTSYIDRSNATTSNYTKTYSKLSEISKHTLKLDVYYYKDDLPHLLVKNTTMFYVTETINGQLELSDGNTTNLNKNTFETNKSLEITASIYDPSGYFDNADIIYGWTIGNIYQIITFNQPTIYYNFTLADIYQVSVNMSAFVPKGGVYHKKLGYFTSEVYSKDKVSNVKLIGSSVVTEGETHLYAITCNASLPAYLYSHLSSNSTCDGAVDECHPILMNDTCSAVIELRFNASGTHCLSINVANDVSIMSLTSDIKVKEVIPHQKAVAITVGVLFGIIACLISIFLVAQQIKKSRRRHVEVANFDFQEVNHNSNLHKFTEKFKKTYKKIFLKVSTRKQEAEYRPLISIEKDACT